MSIEVDDESYHYAEIMGRDDVTLYFSVPHYIDIPLGCYITYMNNNYTLYSVDKMRMEHRRDYEYTITFEGVASELDNYIFTNPNDGRFRFPLTAKSQEHLRLLCLTMSQKTGVTWSVGSYVDGYDVCISYDTMTCLDALKQMAEAFNTEYSVVGRTINLGKVEYFKQVQNQVAISYGKGNGLRPGVERLADTSEKIIGRVYIQGGERNIDYSQYPNDEQHSATLLLPYQWGGGGWWFNGQEFTEAHAEGSLHFEVSADRRSLYLDEEDAPTTEGALDCSDIYPSYEHTVQTATELDSENNIWEIIGDYFASMNYGEYLIANDEPMTVIFQSGSLAGREFSVEWVDASTDSQTGTTTPAHMKIVPSEQDGYPMPARSSGFYPQTGDKFRVFNCYLPDAYIDEAEMSMLDKALRYLWDRCRERFTVKGEIDPIWSSSRWLNIGSHFVPGAYFRFSDPKWENEGVSIRVQSVKTFINKPHQPIVEMSNTISKPTAATILKKASAEAQVLPAASTKESKSFAKRGWADATETMQMLIDAGLEGFTEMITPIAVQTMQLLVGDESLQIKFWTTRACTTEIENPFTYNPSTKKLTAQSCALQHMTLGIKDIKPASARGIDEYLRWNMVAYESAVLDDPDQAYYVYAKCDKLNNGTNHLAGSFIISEKAKPMDGDTSKDEQGNRIMEDAGYYFFLCGILNSERSGNRDFARLYGFTEILPGQITTEVIRGSSGTSWWNLVTNEVHFGDNLTYTAGTNPTLTLNGALVVAGDGTPKTLGAFCGEFDEYHEYGLGDEVVFTDSDGLTSTYRYINYYNSYGYQHAPDEPDSQYWQVFAAGVKGTDGINGTDGVGFVGDPEVLWSMPVPDGQTPPATWYYEKPDPVPGRFIWKQETYTYSDSTAQNPHTYSTYTAEYCAENGTDGTDGTDGLNGPYLYYRGDFDSNATYFGTDDRCDVVHYTDGKYYVAIQGSGEFDGGIHAPGDSRYWSAFMGNFSNIATDLLLANLIYVEKLGVRYLETYLPNSNARISASGNTLEMYDASNVKKLLITGSDLMSLSSSPTDTEYIYSDFSNATNGVVSYSDDVAYITISSTENTVTLPALTITCSYSKSGGSPETLHASASYLIDGQPVSSGSLGEVTLTTGSGSETFTLNSRKLSLPAGSGGGTARHTVSIQMQGNSSGTSLQQMQWGPGNIVIEYGSEGTEIGANGFRVAFSPSVYLSAVRDWATSVISFECRNGSHGLKIASDGIYKWNSTYSRWDLASI